MRTVCSIRAWPVGRGTLAGMTTTASPAVIRQWARAEGLSVGDRGRLSPDILAAYAAQESEARLPAVRAGAPVAGTGRAAPRRLVLRVAAKPAPGPNGVGLRVTARAR